jgi:hypothetical protein
MEKRDIDLVMRNVEAISVNTFFDVTWAIMIVYKHLVLAKMTNASADEKEFQLVAEKSFYFWIVILRIHD